MSQISHLNPNFRWFLLAYFILGLTVPEEPFPQAMRTPERVEFENSLEGEEETEEEQTEHNLRSSISCDLLLGEEEGEEESDSE